MQHSNIFWGGGNRMVALAKNAKIRTWSDSEVRMLRTYKVEMDRYFIAEQT